MHVNSQGNSVSVSRKGIWTWLFNPFHYVAGGKALVAGVVLVLAASLLGSLSNSHFDGVFDFHTGAAAPLWMYVCEGLVAWLALSGLLLLGGMLVSKSRIRLLDVLGTQALARFPTLVTATFALIPGYRRFAAHLAASYVNTLPQVETKAADPVLFGITVLVAVLMTIWMVMLMYRAFSVSCNVTGGKAIGAFMVAVILGEVISKVVIILLLARLL